MKLYEIPMEFALIEKTLDLLLTLNEGEVTPEVEEQEAKLAEFLKEGTAKIDAAICVVKNIEADAQACKDESARLANRARSLANNADRLKALVGSAIDSVFAGKVKTARFTLWMQDGPQSYDVSVAPDCDLLKLGQEFPAFVSIVATPRKKELSDAFKAEKQITDGLIVAENPRSRSLRIR